MKSPFSVRHTVFVLMVLTALMWQGCKKASSPEAAGQKVKSHDGAASESKASSERTAAKASYCEKSFSCKLALVEGKEARDVLITHHDTMVKHCEDIMSKMPPQLRREYEACAGVPCGAELEKCVQGAAQRAARALGLLRRQQKESGKKPGTTGGVKKGSTGTPDATPSASATPAGTALGKARPLQGSVPPPNPMNVQYDSPPPPDKNDKPTVPRQSDVAQPSGANNTAMGPASPPPGPPPGVKLPTKPDFTTVH